MILQDPVRGIGPVGDADATVQVRVLGQTTITAGGVPVEVNRPLERALFVRLALENGWAVRDATLAADLWPDAGDAMIGRRLRVQASRLRRSLGPWAKLLVHAAGGGYRLLGCEVSDVAAARRLTVEARAAARTQRRQAAVVAATAALAHWRGPALEDLVRIPFVDAAVTGIEEWRLELTTLRLTAMLHLAPAEMLVVELVGLAEQHPLNERVQMLLAQALYCAGRQVEALHRLRLLRQSLVDAAGLDVTPQTVQLESRILRHDPTLQPRSVA
ncbi:AfsR/SARP family transcriptional regulator [Pseudonocardia sp. CA-107938]|uniref:AfsR/SARP family transcriptional regulator n=1 Tax=Pseudonocardia sp. CA-107938 TaxID=3240021 RepID=UPI003D944A37